jgi:hypothetical protein
MPASEPKWQVLPHGPLEKLEPNLWRVQGSLPGMSLQRVMTLARLGDGRLVIHSAIALDENEVAEVERWGRPAILVVPNAHHRLDAPGYKTRYPDLMVLCPRSATRRVADVVAVDGDLSAFPRDEAIRCEYLDGTGSGEGVLLVRHADGASLVLNDAVFNMPHLPGVIGWLLKNVTRSSGGPTVSRIARWLLIKDNARFREHLLRLAATPDLKRIIVSHHEMIEEDPAGTLRALAETI